MKPEDTQRQASPPGDEAGTVPSACASDESIVARYHALVMLWSHRDSTMHQWPLLIISATGAILALIFGRSELEDLLALLFTRPHLTDAARAGSSDERAQP